MLNWRDLQECDVYVGSRRAGFQGEWSGFFCVANKIPQTKFGVEHLEGGGGDEFLEAVGAGEWVPAEAGAVVAVVVDLLGDRRVRHDHVLLYHHHHLRERRPRGSGRKTSYVA
jgi:hypothetical protein